MSEDKGNRFGEVAVREGFATREQVRDCLEIQAKLREYGVEPKKLGEIMVEKGFLRSADVTAILSVQKLGASQSRLETRSEMLKQGSGPTQKPGAQDGAAPPPPPSGAFLPKDGVPGYEILELLGQGGMGAVYKARQKSLDRIVALKVLPPRAARDEGFVKRFISEARTVARLNHENIVSGIDVGEANGTYWFVMEHVDGEALSRLVEREGPLKEARALKIAVQIARALEHAHKHGLVHRDVKPQNVLVSRRPAADGGEPIDHAKLCDLGLAKSLEQGERPRTGSGELGMPMGTPHYLSPEQARGEADVDIRSDIYSLGATLYHALTGKTPFEGQSPMVLMTKHLTEDPVPPRERNEDVSRAASDLVLRMMAKAKEERHQTPTELIEDLERVLDGKHGRRGPPRRTAPPPPPAADRPGAAPPRKKKGTSRHDDDSEGRRAGRPTAVRAGPGGDTSSALVFFVLAVLVGCFLIWVVAKDIPGAPSVAEEQAAESALMKAKANIPYVQTADDRQLVRQQLERVIEKYPGTRAAALARELKEQLR